MAVPSPALAGLRSARGWQEEFYRDIHRHPELAHQEHRTAATVANGAPAGPTTRLRTRDRGGTPRAERG